MINKTIKNLNIENIDDKIGEFGSYFKISKKRGIKIFKQNKDIKGSKNITSLLSKKRLIKNAIKEYILLKQAEKSNITPKHPRIEIIKINNEYQIGVSMEHISGKTLYEKHDIFYLDNFHCSSKGYFNIKSKKNDLEIIDYFDDILLLNEIDYNDFHGNNIILSKNKLKLIDFSSKFVKTNKKILNKEKVNKLYDLILSVF